MKQASNIWKHYALGVCYYPEQWPETLWAQDLARMQKAGIKTVRVGEFAWVLLEPKEGEYHFDLFDRFLDLCAKVGMQVIFGTPTATPPAWLTEAYPEALNARPDGILLRHGARRHYTYNAPAYQRLCAAIVEQLGRHYGQHPAIVGWQIDNELNCETDEFYSTADDAAFRRFLQAQYGSLQALNDAWGTVVWSQCYTDWSQIYTPRLVLNGGHNPGLLLDYRRFVSDSCIRFAGMQADILRRYVKPGDFLTTNGLFFLDNHRLMDRALDVYTYDSYPDFALELDKARDELLDRKWSKNLTETRSVCPHFGIMEQQSGAGGWVNRMEMPSPRPGQLRLWAMQSVAHGADFVSFFRWRTAPFGTELYWHGILDYDNRDNRKLREVEAFGRDLAAMDEVCGADFAASFALVKDYDNEFDCRADRWHDRIARHSEREIILAAQLSHTPYDVLYLRDETDPEALAKYPVLLYPHPMIMTERRAALLEAYVAQGGILIVGCRAGFKDIHGRAPMLVQPGLLRRLTGTEVEDFTYVNQLEGEQRYLPVFHDVLTPLAGTQVLARFEQGYYAGKPCLTQRQTGKGMTLHLGSAFSREMVTRLLAYAGVLEPFDSDLSAPEEVELVCRETNGARYYIALNYPDRPASLTLRRPMQNLLTGQTEEGDLTLPPFGVAVWKAE